MNGFSSVVVQILLKYLIIFSFAIVNKNELISKCCRLVQFIYQQEAPDPHRRLYIPLYFYYSLCKERKVDNDPRIRAEIMPRSCQITRSYGLDTSLYQTVSFMSYCRKTNTNQKFLLPST